MVGEDMVQVNVAVLGIIVCTSRFKKENENLLTQVLVVTTTTLHLSIVMAVLSSNLMSHFS